MTRCQSLQTETIAGKLRLVAGGTGAVFVEYIVILVLVAAVSIPTIIWMGVVLSAYYSAQQTVITLPFP
jgi:Flp pilus assembly pilin Flp